MATNRITSSQGPSPYATFYLDCDIAQTDTTNRRWLLRAYLRMSKASGSSYGGGGYQTVRGNNAEKGRFTRDPFLPSGITGWNEGPYDFWVNANDDGYWAGTSTTYPLRMELSYGNVQTLPSGSITIPKMPAKNIPPGKTPEPSVSAVTASSVYLTWSAPSAGTAAISGYDVQWNTSASESGATTQSQGTTRSKSISGLTADTGYFFRVRAKSSAGTGAWSDWADARTLPGVRVGKGGQFVTGAASVGKAGQFPAAQVFVGKGGAFVSPA
ncbi:fibronectin type III domain-containing protein [Microbacterium soli]|uniref:Fibronectin type-III domain-containing protein n=1 Tax=Microbacterium soli TaxID=446075 RepID=A0ABP7NIM4_9MICO